MVLASDTLLGSKSCLWLLFVPINLKIERDRPDKKRRNNSENIGLSVMVLTLSTATHLYLANLKLRSQYFKRFFRHVPGHNLPMKMNKKTIPWQLEEEET